MTVDFLGSQLPFLVYVGNNARRVLRISGVHTYTQCIWSRSPLIDNYLFVYPCTRLILKWSPDGILCIYDFLLVTMTGVYFPVSSGNDDAFLHAELRANFPLFFYEEVREHK